MVLTYEYQCERCFCVMRNKTGDSDGFRAVCPPVSDNRDLLCLKCDEEYQALVYQCTEEHRTTLTDWVNRKDLR